MTLRRLFPLPLLSILLLSFVLAACGGGKTAPTSAPVATATPLPPAATAAPAPTSTPAVQPSPTPEPPTPTAGIQVLDAVFAQGLNEDMQPENPGADFSPDETVYLSVKIKGRPKKGVVSAQFYWRDNAIATADVDLSDINSGVLFSVGEDTYAGYTLTHEQNFPISDHYHVTVLVNDQAVGDYTFHVIPPADAIPTQISNVTLARGTDADYNPVDPTTTFAPDDTVYLVGRGDLGLDTWLQADWYVDGKLDDAGTRSLTLQENASDTGFAFSYLPANGWPVGEHSVVLTMNDEEVGRYAFTVEELSSGSAFDENEFWNAFILPDDAELMEVTEGLDLRFATALTEPQVFDFYDNWLRQEGWKQQAPTEAMVTRPHQRWRKQDAELHIEIEGQDEQNRTIVWVQVKTI